MLATDEATFTRDGIQHFQNTHIWRGNGQLIGPFVLPARLTANNYLLFLENDLPELLEDVSLNVRQ